MARRKKRRNRLPDQKAFQREPETFNPAFGDLACLKGKDPKTAKVSEQQKPPKDKPRPDETQHFMEAMSDVNPLPQSKKNRIAPVPNPDVRPAHLAKNDEQEVLAHLTDLVSGLTQMDISFSDEYIEGSVHGFDQKLMGKLKKGKFPIQAHIDLHGLTKQDAEIRVRDFLLQSHRQGLRCVLVVHGRGLNSENHIPVLKDRLPIWLNRGAVRKIVLAFSTAMPYDGGTGAIYILLKRQKGPQFNK